jgi:hypothetical protein
MNVLLQILCLNFFWLNPFTNDGNFSCITKLKEKKGHSNSLTHLHVCMKQARELKGDEIKFCRTLILGKQNRK